MGAMPRVTFVVRCSEELRRAIERKHATMQPKQGSWEVPEAEVHRKVKRLAGREAYGGRWGWDLNDVAVEALGVGLGLLPARPLKAAKRKKRAGK